MKCSINVLYRALNLVTYFRVCIIGCLITLKTVLYFNELVTFCCEVKVFNFNLY